MKTHVIATAIELGARKRRRDHIFGVVIVIILLVVGLFVAIPLWLHWAEVVLEFWGLKQGRFTLT